MAKHRSQSLTAKQLAKVKRDRASLAAERDQIIAHGQTILTRQRHLHDAISAIKAQRQAQEVSLSELARRTGISKSSLSRMENDPNANPTITTLMRLAEALGQEITIQLHPSKDAA